MVDALSVACSCLFLSSLSLSLSISFSFFTFVNREWTRVGTPYLLLVFGNTYICEFIPHLSRREEKGREEASHHGSDAHGGVCSWIILSPRSLTHGGSCVVDPLNRDDSFSTSGCCSRGGSLTSSDIKM